MKLLSWNCQGLGQALTRRALNDIIFKHRPCLVFLMETKQKTNYLERLKRKFRYSNSIYVEPHGYSGGLALWWTDEVHISIFYSDKNMLDGCCSDADYSVSWHFSFVYGEPNVQLRQPMWSRMLNLRRPPSIPWLIMGDLNLVGECSDKKGKRPPLAIDRRIYEELICVGSLREIAFRGSKYTWVRGNIRERLDRALINDGWGQLFPNAQLFHCARIGSDHCPLVLCLKAIPAIIKKQFRYELKWQLQNGYDGAVIQGWSTNRVGSPLFKMAAKISQCRQSLKEWSKSSGSSHQQLAQLQQELEALQQEELTEPNISRQQLLIDRIHTHWIQEEAYWFQRARTNWLTFGDRNSKFFHAIASRRRQNNFIFQLKHENGQLLEDT
ncbi:hypothetical protein SLE2022_038790 [Rubroshorea leprosula]